MRGRSHVGVEKKRGEAATCEWRERSNHVRVEREGKQPCESGEREWSSSHVGVVRRGEHLRGSGEREVKQPHMSGEREEAATSK